MFDWNIVVRVFWSCRKPKLCKMQKNLCDYLKQGIFNVLTVLY
jgi:hypothetical protein